MSSKAVQPKDRDGLRQLSSAPYDRSLTVGALRSEPYDRSEADAVEALFDEYWDDIGMKMAIDMARPQETQMYTLRVRLIVTMLSWHTCQAWERAVPRA